MFAVVYRWRLAPGREAEFETLFAGEVVADLLQLKRG